MTVSESDRAVQGLVRACCAVHEDFGTLRERLLYALNRIVPFDAAFMAAADPESLLFTNAFADEALRPSAAQFLDNEFGTLPDVNRFVDLARAHDPVASLDEATEGDREASERWREIMDPIGMGDEMRVALRVDGAAWGFLCLHRVGSRGFSSAEMTTLRKATPYLGEALRRTAGLGASGPAGSGEGLNAVILVAANMIMAVAGEDIDVDGGPITIGGPLPVAFEAVVRRLEAIEASSGQLEALPPASIRMATRNGSLIAVHAARLQYASGVGPIVLTVTPAAPTERSSLLLAVHGLTPAQCRVATLVLQGRTTSQISNCLSISSHTVQDHLKVVFDKVGVRSRRELVNAMMHP